MTRRFTVIADGEFTSDDPTQHQIARDQIKAVLEHVPGTAVSYVIIDDIPQDIPDFESDAR